MTTTTRGKATIGGVLVGLLVLALTTGSLFAQEPTATPGGTATPDHMATTSAATPEAADPQTAGQMERMMEQCLAMMEMMSMMMGGDMAGTMEGQDMQGMMDMPTPAATPGA